MIVAGGLFLYFNKSKPQTQKPTDITTFNTAPSGGSNESVSSMTDSSPILQTQAEIMVMGNSFKFDPNQIKVKLGDTVKIRFMNTGGTHNLTIEGLNVATKTISNGSEEMIEFTADKAGEYQFYCSVGNHREQGMAGTLVVE